MIKPHFSSEETTSVLTMLAIVECATAVTLTPLLETRSPNKLQHLLTSHPHVIQKGDTLCLRSDIAAAHLHRLKHQNESQFRLLHQHVLNKLSPKLLAGGETIELTLMIVYKRLANHLLTTIDDDFRTLIAISHTWPLKENASKQWRSYFEGVVLFQQERYEAALTIFEALLAKPDLDLRVRGRTLNSRAIGLRIQGQLEAALDGYQQSLTIWRKLDDELNVAKALLNMGASAYFLRRHAQADRWVREAIAIFEKGDYTVLLGPAKNQLGLICRDMGQWDEALSFFREYIHCGKSADNADMVGIGLLNVGEILLFQGRLEEALSTLRQALSNMTRQAYRIDAYLHMGLALIAQHNLASAKDVFQQALDLAEEIGRHEVLPHAHYLLGKVIHEQGNSDGALPHYVAAVKVIEKSRMPMRDEGVKISLLGLWQQVYEVLVLYWLARGNSSEAFAWSERARARAFADAIGASSEDDGDLFTATAVTTQNALPPNSAFLSYFTTGVLEHDMPMLKAISDDNPLRQHLLTEPKVILFVITPEGIQAYDCTINPNMFTITSPRGNDPRRFLNARILSRLSAALLFPAASALQAKKLTIAAHGPLHTVPFAALADDATRPLLRHGGPSIVHTPSATVLLQQHQPLSAAQTVTKSCLAIGYNGRYLRYTEAEAQLIARMSDGKAWIGGQTDKSLLQTSAVNQRLLHFACHGWFDQDEPLESYLEVGPDCHLTAREVIQNWHIAAELVVLSACQTGVSRVLRSDEPMGLIRAFMSAGATAVLVTHWPVEDLPTFLLMLRFYELLLQKGKAPAAALRDAQVWLRELTITDCTLFIASQPLKPTEWRSNLPQSTSGDYPPFAEPQHWAAFTLYGDNNEL